MSYFINVLHYGMFFKLYPNERLTTLGALCRWQGFGRQRAYTVLSRTRISIRKEAHITKVILLIRFSKGLRKIKFCTRDLLKRAQKKRVKELMFRRLYRARRLEAGLPVRGQKTKNNSKTARKRLML